MATRLSNVSKLKKGNYVMIDDAPCRITDIQVSRPGKHGHAKVRLTGVGILDDRKRVTVMPGHDNIDVPIVDKRKAQVLSVHGETATVMDSESYETFDIKIPEEFEGEVVNGATILYWNIMGNNMMKQVRGS